MKAGLQGTVDAIDKMFPDSVLTSPGGRRFLGDLLAELGKEFAAQ